MNRLLAQLQWDRLFTTPMGQRITVSGLVRADGYHVADAAFADDPAYAGEDGFRGRIVPLVAVDLQWPLVGPLGRGTQNLTPRLQFVASTRGANRGIPNEDSRAVELDDLGLFAFNRFPGFDRWEGGVRMAYGLSWDWARPGIALSADIGQSYRFTDHPGLFPEGSGLEDRLSDIVGRVTLRAGRFGSLTQRVRLDKDDLTVRRSELDLSFGTDSTFATVGYLRFNRDSALEDLVDQEELRFGAQVALFRYWSAFASMIIDLTSTGEDPATVNDGFQPIRHRVGVMYQDECFDFRFTWRRNYVDNLNAPRGNSFSVSFRLTNLGR
ncbi:MAG: LPS-assembly protein LptD, partial [Thermaurantiacus tibetensis]